LQPFEFSVDGSDFTLLHDGHAGDGVVFVPLHRNAFEHLEEGDRRHQERRWLFNDGREVLCAWSVGEIRQPGR
jgi:hypothetical protein